MDDDADTRRAGLFIFAGLQDETPERLEPFRPLAPKVRELLLDGDAGVRCDALMAFAYFDPGDLHVARARVPRRTPTAATACRRSASSTPSASPRTSRRS